MVRSMLVISTLRQQTARMAALRRSLNPSTAPIFTIRDSHIRLPRVATKWSM